MYEKTYRIMLWFGLEGTFALFCYSKNLPAILNLGLPAANSYFCIFWDCWLGFGFFVSSAFAAARFLSTQIEK